MRTFIAIDMPEKIRKEIVKIQEQLPEFKGKKTEFENLHLTLKFLGEIDSNKIDAIKTKLKEIEFRRFETVIDSIGFFDNSQPRIYERKIIVWLHLTNCEKLQKEIDEKLKKLFPQEKRFMSHLTIARIKNLEDRKKFIGELKEIKIPGMKFAVENFKLKKSELSRNRPTYEDLEIYNLKI